MPYMPLDIVRLLDSDFNQMASNAEFRAGFNLWAKSFLQVPAASLPDDDRILRGLSGAGEAWPEVREMALRGWVKCNDGRLYHAVVAEKAAVAWGGRVKFQARTDAARRALAEKRERERVAREAANCGAQEQAGSDRGGQALSQGLSQTVKPSVTDAVTGVKNKGEGESKGESKKIYATQPTDSPADAGSEFEEFWEAYPYRVMETGQRKKVAKSEAKAAYETARKRTPASVLLAAAKNYAATTAADPRYVKDCFRWLKGKRWMDEELPINGNTPTAGGMPAAWADDDLWVPYCDGVTKFTAPDGTTSRNGLRPSVNGWVLPEAVIMVAEAAKLPHTYTDWKPLIAWLNDGFLLDFDIVQVIAAIASRPGYNPPRSLAYFDKAVRSNSTEYDKLRVPVARAAADATQH